MIRKTRLAGTVAAALTSGLMLSPAYAEEGLQYKLSGFGTLAATVSDDGDRAFRSSLSQSKGSAAELDLGVDSKLGLQGQVIFSPQFSATAQLLAQRKRVDDSFESNRDFDIGVEWLFGQYTPTQGLDLRLGRVVMPAFMISDSRNVGYAQPWLRAPLSMYAQIPMSTLDGVQVLWRYPVADALVTLQPSYGQGTYNISTGSPQQRITLDSRMNKMFNLNVSVEWQDWTARFGYTEGTTPVDLDLFGVGAFGLPGIAFDLKDRFTNFGVQYDNGKAVAMAEWARRRVSNYPGEAPAAYAAIYASGINGVGPTLAQVYAGALANQQVANGDFWYVAGGWRFGDWLPMVAIGQAKDNLRETTNKTLDVSVRYELQRNVSLKAQWTRVEADDTSAFVVAGSDDDHVNVIAVGVDFVF